MVYLLSIIIRVTCSSNLNYPKEYLAFEEHLVTDCKRCFWLLKYHLQASSFRMLIEEA
jgi:hypothetical protein